MIEEIKIQNLTTGFNPGKRDEKILHKGLNLILKPGETVCILGPNGAGKSTLLRTLLGYQGAMLGEIFFGEQPLSKLSIKELSKIVAVVLTEKIDDFYFTAYEVVMTGRYPYGSLTGKLTDKDITIIHQALEKVGVNWLAHQNFYKLSDGEKQKVMIARAIAQDTPFIFLDEPVAYIDSPSRIGIMQLLRQLSAEMNKGILMATHDLDSALQYANHLWLLGKDGKWEKGRPEDMVSKGYINAFFDNENVSFNTGNQRFEWTGKDEL